MTESLEKFFQEENGNTQTHEAQVPYVEVHGTRQDASTLLCYALVGGSSANHGWCGGFFSFFLFL